MTMFDEAAWPLIYAVSWIVESDSERAERLARLLHHGGKTAESAQAWRELRDALLDDKIAASGRKRTFRTVVDDTPPGPPGFFAGANVEYKPRRKQIVDSVGTREQIPALAWLDAVSPITGPANYESVMLLKRDVLLAWPPLAKSSAQISRKRGAPPKDRGRIEEEMLRDVAHGYDLAGATEEELKEKYRTGSRNPVRDARKNILARIVRK